MDTLEIIVLGLALSMDAFAVTISNMFAYRDITRIRLLLMPLFFGAFQGIMPVLGYFAGTLVSNIISRFAGVLTFVILGIIGGKMIWDAFHPDSESPEKDSGHKLTVAVVFFQAIATSIDALAVGVSFAALNVDMMQAALLIAATTFITICVALGIGKRFGSVLGEKAPLVGGVVLVLIGIKALL